LQSECKSSKIYEPAKIIQHFFEYKWNISVISLHLFSILEAY